MKYARVIIDISAEQLDRTFTYAVPEELAQSIHPGVRVQLPFGNAGRTRKAVVIELTDHADFDESRIKPISSIIKGAEDIESELIELADMMAREYGSTMNQALMTVLPVKATVRKNSRRRDALSQITGIADSEPESGSGADSCSDSGSGSCPESASGTDSCSGSGTSFMDRDKAYPSSSAESGSEAVQYDDRSAAATHAKEHSASGNAFLNAAQQNVCDEILSETERPSLLYGITGSGKTRVYIELIRRMQEQGKRSIVLIPEISLTFQTVNELARYFGDKISVMHSKLSAGERYDQYRKARDGETFVMVGPRSALFTPFKDLGLIIIDEEHERTYQSETAPRYDTREVANWRVRMSGAKLVLGSATPSLSSYRKAVDGSYALHKLLERAHPGARLPEISVADMRRELEKGNRSIFSERLKKAIDERLLRNEQVMLFINRRGYAGFVSCRSCGTVVKCPHCDVSLTAHNSWYITPDGRKTDSALLSCHYCGFSMPMPKTCPECGSKYIAPFGTGTQKLELACRNTFPRARILRMDADTTATKNAHERILAAFKAHKADILIGTQMIVKGHDFENVTLVGIVAADMSLNTSEYDASERCYQLITQAAGRSGRGESHGEVIIQSYDPSHYAISCAAERDYESFYEREMSYRRLLNYPPETYMLFVHMRSESEEALDEAAAIALQAARSSASEDSEIIGPCSEGIYKIKDNYRKIIYIKNRRHDIITRIREDIMNAARGFAELRVPVYISFDIR